MDNASSAADANPTSQDAIAPEPLDEFFAMCAARHLCIMATMDKLRKYNETDQGLTQALKDWPSHPGAITMIQTPLDSDRSSQETVTGQEVSESMFHLNVHFLAARKVVGAKGFWKDVFVSSKKRKEKKRLDEAIQQGMTAMDVIGDIRQVESREFYEDGTPGNHGDLALFLNNLSREIENELVQVLRGSGPKDYEALTNRTKGWAKQIQKEMNEALRLRQDFMRMSKTQFKGAKGDISALIVNKFRLVGSDVDNFEW